MRVLSEMKLIELKILDEKILNLVSKVESTDSSKLLVRGKALEVTEMEKRIPSALFAKIQSLPSFARKMFCKFQQKS